MIAERIVEAVAGGQRPDPPAAEQIRSEHSPDNGPQLVALDDAARQAVTDVGRQRAHLALVGIEREGEEVLVLASTSPG